MDLVSQNASDKSTIDHRPSTTHGLPEKIDRCIPGHVVGWAVAGAMALCQFTDNFVFSFPLTFVPQQLEILDYSSADISVLVCRQ